MPRDIDPADPADQDDPTDPHTDDPEREAKLAILNAFQQLLVRLWEPLTQIIGPIATAGIIRLAWRDTGNRHPVLDHLAITDTGVAFDQLQEHLSSVTLAELRTALWALLDATVQMLSDLTGAVLMRKIDPLLQDFKQRMG